MNMVTFKRMTESTLSCICYFRFDDENGVAHHHRSKECGGDEKYMNCTIPVVNPPVHTYAANT